MASVKEMLEELKDIEITVQLAMAFNGRTSAVVNRCCRAMYSRLKTKPAQLACNKILNEKYSLKAFNQFISIK